MGVGTGWGARRKPQLYVRLFSGPLIKPQNERAIILCLFRGRQDNIFRLNLQERIFVLEFSFVPVELPHEKRIVEFISAPHRQGITPRSTVSIKRIGEFMPPLLALMFRPFPSAPHPDP